MDPIAFTILGLEIRWYGILIALAMVIGVVITSKRAPSFSIEPDRVLDFAIICLPVSVIGARLYYVIFNWDYYAWDIMKIIDTRSGGLAIHGGLIAGILAALVLCYIWNIRPFNALDLVVPAIALGQSIGRWGNYINGEAYGSPTNLPWAIEIDGMMVHPTFFYESIWCFLLFFVLLKVSKNRKFEGQIFLLYGIWYSFERFFVEQLRTDSLMYFGLKTAQIISLIIFVSFVIIYFIKRKKNNKRMFY